MTLIFIVLVALAILYVLSSISSEYQKLLQYDVEVVLLKSTQPLSTEEIIEKVGQERARAAWHLRGTDFNGKKYEPKKSRLQKALNGLLIRNKIDHFYHGGDAIAYIHRMAPSARMA